MREREESGGVASSRSYFVMKKQSERERETKSERKREVKPTPRKGQSVKDG